MVNVTTLEEEEYREETPGRLGKNTRYVRKVKKRFDIEYEIETIKIAEDTVQDGIFPLVTNVQDFTAEEILLAYKRQIEVRNINCL